MTQQRPPQYHKTEWPETARNNWHIRGHTSWRSWSDDENDDDDDEDDDADEVIV